MVPNARQRLRDDLVKADGVGLCVDIWSSKARRGYLGVTIHFVDDRGSLGNHVLGCPYFGGSRTAERIFELTEAVVEGYGVADKVIFVSVDNGAEMIKAFRSVQPLLLEAESQNDDGDEG